MPEVRGQRKINLASARTSPEIILSSPLIIDRRQPMTVDAIVMVRHWTYVSQDTLFHHLNPVPDNDNVTGYT